jgi:hypothetical protein
MTETVTRSDMDRVYRIIAQMRSEAEVERGARAETEAKLKSQLKAVEEKVARLSTRQNDFAQSLQKLSKRVSMLVPKNIEGALRTLEYMNSQVLPTQMRMQILTELCCQLDARNVKPEKWELFVRSWWWAMDNKNNAWWSEMHNMSLDSISGRVQRAYLEYTNAKKGKK